jgi:hypothetical protein
VYCGFQGTVSWTSHQYNPPPPRHGELTKEEREALRKTVMRDDRTWKHQVKIDEDAIDLCAMFDDDGRGTSLGLLRFDYRSGHFAIEPPRASAWNNEVDRSGVTIKRENMLGEPMDPPPGKSIRISGGFFFDKGTWSPKSGTSNRWDEPVDPESVPEGEEPEKRWVQWALTFKNKQPEVDRVELDDAIDWSVADKVIDTGVRTGGGQFHPYKALEGDAIVDAYPAVTVTHPSEHLWRVTKVVLPAVRELKQPIRDAIPVPGKNVFDRPSLGVDGHYEDVARNLELYGETSLTLMKWWVDEGTMAHEDSHRADHAAWFKARWGEKGGIKEGLKARLEALLPVATDPEALQEAAGPLLTVEIRAAETRSPYKGDEAKAYAAGAKVFRAKAAELRKQFAKH